MRPMLEGLAQFYIYDFSELDPPQSDSFAFGADGLFTPLPWFENFWGKPGTVAYLIRYEGRAAGFICIDAVSHADGRAVENNMGEFFVVRQYRGGAIATEALRQVLVLRPGYWELAVAERNARAKAFWAKAIKGMDGLSDVKCVAGDGVQWTGPIWSFVAG